MTAIRKPGTASPRRVTPGGARTGAGSLVGKLRRRVSVMPLLLGLLGVVAASIGILVLLGERGAVTEVWVAAGDLQANQPLTADDVTPARVSGVVEFQHVAVTDVSRADLVAGMIPKVDVPAGTPLSAAHFYQPGEFLAVPPGSVTVAVVSSRSRIPDGVAEGDTVLLVGVPGSSGGGASGRDWPGSSPLEVEATVVAITEYGSGSDLALTVAVPTDIGGDAAWLASENRLVVAHVP